MSLLPSDTFTYTSDAHLTNHWLDHVLCSPDAHDSLGSLNVDYTLIGSDHFPMICSFRFLDTSDTNHICNDATNINNMSRVRWQNVSTACKEQYYFCTLSELQAIDTCLDCFECRSVTCSSDPHRKQIAHVYSQVIEVLMSCKDRCVGQNRRACKQNVPGWNERVKAFHSAARRAFLYWKSMGCPRDGQIAEDMKSARRNFKRALRNCKQNEELIVADILANTVINDSRKFWSTVKAKHGAKNFAKVVGGSTDPKEITNLWLEHFMKIMNTPEFLPGDNSNDSTEDLDNPADVCDDHFTVFNAEARVPGDASDDRGNATHTFDESLFPTMVSSAEIAEAVLKLAKNKASKLDGICIESLLLSHPFVFELLSKLFSSMLIHGFIPDDLMKCLIIPVVKSQVKSKSDINNYRPIAIASTLLKLLEVITFERIRCCLGVSDNQFGYQKTLSTESCKFALKSILYNYVKRDCKMHVSFLDASKAFDHVDHSTLFRILKGRNVPKNIFKILQSLYRNQKCQVSWDNELSREFCSTRGVKQGGVLSPHFFNVYIDELSARLRSIRTGCVVDDKVVNHLIYADDIVLFSPTANGLQRLLNACNSFAEEFKLSFNPMKSVCMTLNQNKKLDCIPVPTFLLQGKALAIVDEIKYLGSIISCSLNDDCDLADRVR